MRKALVLGAGGFIGNRMVSRLKTEGFFVRGVDLKYPEFSDSEADEFSVGDLRNVDFVGKIASKSITREHKLDAPTGVRGRNSDNSLIRSMLGWDYSMTLEEGLTKTFKWINQQVEISRKPNQ